MEGFQTDLLKISDLITKVQNISFLLKESHQKIVDEEYTKHLQNLLGYVSLLEKNHQLLQNKYSLNDKKQIVKTPPRPEFSLANHLANQKAKELL